MPLFREERNYRKKCRPRKNNNRARKCYLHRSPAANFAQIIDRNYIVRAEVLGVNLRCII